MSTLNYSSKPSPENMRRGVKLIEAVLGQFPFYETGEKVLKFHSNWRTDYKDYSAVIRVARRIARQPYTLVKDGEGPVGGGWSGSWGHVESKGGLDLDELIERTVEKIYEREQQQPISDEEISAWLKNAEQTMTTQEGKPDWRRIDNSYEKEIVPRIPRSKDEIRSSLTLKVLELVYKIKVT